MDARLHPELEAQVGYFDTEQGDRFHVVDTTCAWNWQMGTQLQWVDGISDSKIIYNVRTQDKTAVYPGFGSRIRDIHRSEEHTSELQSLMRISYAVFCLKKQ